MGQRVGRRRRPALLALGAGAQKLRPAGRAGGARRRGRAADPGAGGTVLAQLLPELGPAREATASGSAARLTLFEAVCAVLDQASRTVPLVVILDDLHAAGRPSALLLRFAAAARLSRVLLLATYRTAEAAADPDVSDVIAALESVGPPLPWRPVRDGHGSCCPARRPTCSPGPAPQRGNPLFVSQVARLLGPGAAAVEEVPVPPASGRPSAARSPGSASPRPATDAR